MCVPLVATYKTKNLTPYHLGRLTAYLTVGTAIYFIGEIALRNQWLWLAWGLLFLGYFIKVSKDEFLSHHCCIKKTVPQKRVSSLALFGFLNGLLPCAWLFLILITLSKIQSLFLFYIFIVIFWVGTIPVFSVINLTHHLTSKYFPRLRSLVFNRKLFFIIYLSIAIYALTLHFKTPLKHEAEISPSSLICT